ncbi:MAG: tetratricopeptide repeat protein [Candidatus Cloacimonadota bacterium]|nr:tetratricopeptide repeat protein [Candidatus Cloacimonadota bacterium]
MAKNKEKFAFGIFKDGLKVKIAQLALSNGIVTVQSLEETILSSALFRQEVEKKEDAFVPDETGEDEIEIPELTEIEDDAFSLPEMSEFEDTDDFDSSEKDDMLPGLRDLQNFLQQFPLEKGRISFNANNEQISYFKFDSSYGTRNLHKRLLEELLSKDEIKANNYSFDYILNSDKSGLAFVHIGKFRLFHALRDINLILSKERYFYSCIDTNEICLTNVVNHNYVFSEDDYVLILYIGFDYKVGIVLKNGMHIKTFPIIVPDSDEITMRETIYSKVLLEQDISNIPISRNILLVGDSTSDEDLEYFRSASQEGDNITRIDLAHLSVQEGMGEKITPERIARYAIPIALAWKTLVPKNKKFSSTNLLPNRVIENQKYFKIAWHGFLVLAAIFYFAFAGTIKNLELKQNIIDYGKKNYTIERELSRNRELIKRLNEIKARLNELQANLLKVEAITGNKNQWNHILDVYSRSLNKNRLSWLRDISSNNNGFTVDGYTMNRRAVIVFSQLFPESKITSVSKNDNQELTIWRFNISSNYPEPKSWKSVNEEETDLKKSTKKEETEKATIEETKEEPEKKEITETPEEINNKYHSILSLYFSGNINNAFNQFSEFVKSYPQHKMTYNAKYFIGECLYLMNQYSEARETLEMVYKLNGSKSPDALIMLGNCSEKENDLKSAIQYWNTLIEKYPDNDLSKAAQYKIDKIEGK